MTEQATQEAEKTIACILSEREQAERGDFIARDLFPGARTVEELADGYAFQFPGDDDWTARVLDFVAAERRCCPFFTFEVVFAPHASGLWLRLRGSEAIKAFVRETFLSGKRASP